jgi:predicted FMN-binding regulatory protein PaiB
MCAHIATPRGSGSKPANGIEYPPRRHLEHDREKLYGVIERFSFATLVSVRDGEALATHIPLTLDRDRRAQGVLFGHMDRANPQAACLDARPILAIFHGPNAYISPHTYQSDQLPTWNSIAVHARGTVRLLPDRAALLRVLTGICETDHRPGAYRLDPNDPRIALLIDGIVGFEIEIEELIGRFKLSQDQTPADRQLAAAELARHADPVERGFVERVVGCPHLQARNGRAH